MRSEIESTPPTATIRTTAKPFIRSQKLTLIKHTKKIKQKHSKMITSAMTESNIEHLKCLNLLALQGSAPIQSLMNKNSACNPVA